MMNHICKDSELDESDFITPSNPPVKSSFLFKFREDDPQQAESLMQKLVKKGRFGKAHCKIVLFLSEPSGSIFSD